MQTLPTQDIDVNAIYLVPIQDPQTSDNYAEYIYLNGVWEKLGETPIEIDLTDYVKNTDYATGSVGGVIKATSGAGIYVGSTGNLYASTKSYSDYSGFSASGFIGKGTLENVITGKGLVSDTDYATTDKGGVVRVNSYSSNIDTSGRLRSASRDYSYYENTMDNYHFISKGTLENVITGKGLVSNTDYATESTGGVIKTYSVYGIGISSQNVGGLYPSVKTYSSYSNAGVNLFISKGTLENVLAEYYKKQVVLTQAEYDQITPDANTLYFITD